MGIVSGLFKFLGSIFKQKLAHNLIRDDSLQSLIGGIGNELHNLSCEHQNNDHLRSRLGELSSRAWELSSRAGQLE
jgi:hypothetical protein